MAEAPALPLLELRSLVERRLESARLPCAKLVSSGLGDLIRTPTGISHYMTVAELPHGRSAEAPTKVRSTTMPARNHARKQRRTTVPARKKRWALLGGVFGAGLAVVSVLAASAGAQPVAASASPPVNTSAPVVSGQPYVGRTLATTVGTWQNNPTSYSYQWIRCDALGNNCVQISGATSKTYTPTSADVNYRLASWVTAKNSGGTVGPVNSKPTEAITPALPPKITTQPSIVGKPLVDAELFADPGKYSGGAVARFVYQWQRCNQTLNCNNISGANSQRYKATSADVDQRLRVQVTAANPFGRTTNPSKATEPITVPVVVVSTTMTASVGTTICCQKIRLSGTITPVKAGEPIRIFARQVDDLANLPVATATTDASGNWSATVTPVIQTSYTAQTSTSTSQPVTTAVHPRIGFGINGNTFSAKVTGRETFAGRIAYFQMQTASGGWSRIALVVINQFSVAKFHVALKKGHTYTLRIYLPQAQAGPGYLDGTSHARRVGGTA